MRADDFNRNKYHGLTCFYFRNPTVADLHSIGSSLDSRRSNIQLHCRTVTLNISETVRTLSKANNLQKN